MNLFVLIILIVIAFLAVKGYKKWLSWEEKCKREEFTRAKQKLVREIESKAEQGDSDALKKINTINEIKSTIKETADVAELLSSHRNLISSTESIGGDYAARNEHRTQEAKIFVDKHEEYFNKYESELQKFRNDVPDLYELAKYDSANYLKYNFYKK